MTEQEKQEYSTHMEKTHVQITDTMTWANADQDNTRLKSLGSTWRVTKTKSCGWCIYHPQSGEHRSIAGHNGWIPVPDLITGGQVTEAKSVANLVLGVGRPGTTREEDLKLRYSGHRIGRTLTADEAPLTPEVIRSARLASMEDKTQ